MYNLTEAFKRLSLLEDDFNFSSDAKEVADELTTFMADDIEAPDEIEIIDKDADNENELQDSYVGKVILECDCCHTRIYKDADSVVIDEETNLANVEEACPVCGTESGYKIIGKIEAFDNDKNFDDKEPEEEEEIEEPEDIEDLDDNITDDEIEEALREALDSYDSTEVITEDRHDPIEYGEDELELAMEDPGIEPNFDLDSDFEDEDGNTYELEEVDENYLLASRTKDGELKDGIVYKHRENAEQDLKDMPDDGLVHSIEDIDPMGSYADEEAVDEYDDIDEGRINEAAEYNNDNAEKFVQYLIDNDGMSGSMAEITPRVVNKGDFKLVHLYSQTGDIKIKFYPVGRISYAEKLYDAGDYVDDEETSQGSTHVDEDGTAHLSYTFNDWSEFVAWLKDGHWFWTEDQGDRLPESKQLEGEQINEDLNDVEVKTEDGNVNVQKDGDKVIVDFAPESEDIVPEGEGEMIAPLSDEEISDIAAGMPEEETNLDADLAAEEPFDDLDLEDELEAEEEPEEDEDVEESLHEDVDCKEGDCEDENSETDEKDEEIEEAHCNEKFYFEEFDEESFDKLCESYLRRVYSNVDKFTSSNAKLDNGNLVIEGLITFSSGKTKATSFKFTDLNESKKGNTILRGMNETFSNFSNAFVVRGNVVENKFIGESMIYSYATKQLNESNESDVVKVYGRVVVK